MADGSVVNAYSYLNDGTLIYARSRSIIEAETGLSAVPEALREVAVRLIHSCGMTDVVKDLDASPGRSPPAAVPLQAGRRCSATLT